MPYIEQSMRDVVNDGGLASLEQMNLSPGALTYIFTRLLRAFSTRNGIGYTTYATQVGILETCKLELYRQRVAPYEDFKKERNGDV